VWLIASLAAVAGGLAVVVATWLESEARTEPASTGPVSPEELRDHGLPLVWRGYAPGHVDALLARTAATLEQVRVDAPTQVHEGTVPGFIAATFPEESAPDAGEESDDDPYAWAWDDPEPSSGEELEDGGGDSAGGLDR
jgi:DivIVA domain-containing protein